MKQYLFWFGLLVILLVGLLVANFLHVPFKIYSKGIVLPSREWSLKKNAGGEMISVLKDNVNNTITNYFVTEFQRGEMAGFRLNQQIFLRDKLNTGDTVGIIYSAEEEQRFVDLQAQHQVKQSLLKVYNTGEKPEMVSSAYEAMIKAENDFETQKKIAERKEILHTEKVIPDQEYELSINDLLIKEQNLNIARSNFEVVRTGAKKEQIDYMRSEISALELRMSQLQQKLNSFHILCPIEGTISSQRSVSVSEEVILNVSDNSSFVIILPVEIHKIQYLQPGQAVILSPGTHNISYTAKVLTIDNVVQLIGQRQCVFITAMLDPEGNPVQSGLLVEATIICDVIKAKNYLLRIMYNLYAN